MGCEGYPDCDQTYPIPQRGDIIGTGDICPQCNSPKIKVLGGRRPWILCLDPDCPTKAEYREKKAARDAKAAAAADAAESSATGAAKTAAKKTATKKSTTAKKAATKKTAVKKTTAAKATTRKTATKAAAGTASED